MASTGVVALLTIFAVLPYLGSGETCLMPDVTSHVYTTTETTMSTQTVVVVEFQVKCQNGLKELNLHAEFNGKTLPATRVEGSSYYQVSFSDEHKNIPAGKYTMRVFDEEGYADLRKAQRSGDDVANIKALFAIGIDHQGASKGPWVQSEMVAISVAVLVWYLAYNAKSKLEG